MENEVLSQIEILLRDRKDLETEADIQTTVEKLEIVINKLNAAANMGQELVSDGVYDTLIDRLRQLDDGNPLLHQVWSESATDDFDVDLDQWLIKYPMLSIQTIKQYTDAAFVRYKKSLRNYASTIRMVLSMKINGHGVRIIRQYGHLTKATTRGRSTAGRDITRHMRLILGEYDENLVHVPFVELRAEVALSFSNFEVAKNYNPDIKSAFTGVSSMIRESASDDEIRLLDVLVYDILSDDLHFDYLTQKYEYLTDLGYKVPAYLITDADTDNLEEWFNEKLMTIENATLDYEYYTDGLVAQIDNIAVFMGMGQEDKFRNGNIALKMGKWEQNVYSGALLHIAWESGKQVLTPVAIIEGTMTATGSTVSRVPLYNPANILVLDAYQGNTIHFRFGGESGVLPCLPDGTLLKENKDETISKGSRVVDIDGRKYLVNDQTDEDLENDYSYIFGDE